MLSELDPRYDSIKPMYDKGKIKSFLDIFKHVPKSTVAADMGKNRARFSSQLKHLKNFSLPDLWLIGQFCRLTEVEILRLFAKELEIQEKEKKKKGSI